MVQDPKSSDHRFVQIALGDERLEVEIEIPRTGSGVIVFAPGEASRDDARQSTIAAAMREGGLGTVRLASRDVVARATDHDGGRAQGVERLARRLEAVHDWLATDERVRQEPLGYFGQGAGAAAALVAAAMNPRGVGAVISSGGRPDLAGVALRHVRCPTLFIVGGDDVQVLALNRLALRELAEEKALHVVAGATHRFDEPGALDDVTRVALYWFQRHLAGAAVAGGAERSAGRPP